MTRMLHVACVQMTATPRIAENIALAEGFIREAVAKGAQLVALPEICNLVQRDRGLAALQAQQEEECTALAAFRGLARELKVWLHVGSMVRKLPAGAGQPFANRGYMIDPTGQIMAQYDKIHMFDVDLSEGESYRESHAFRPGEQASLVATPWGGYGMTVCYDVRFPHLYRDLAKAGAAILAVPAAFTQKTGQAHWHILLRARAIENGCFVIAPAQCGLHEDGRRTYGHALIVAPWGEILADAGTEPGLAMAKLDLAQVDEARRMIPSLRNERHFAGPADYSKSA